MWQFLKKYKAPVVLIMLLSLICIPIIYYLPEVAYRPTTLGVPLWDWLYSYVTISLVALLSLAAYALCKKYKHDILLPAKVQMWLYVAAGVIFVLFNPWICSTYPQFPVSVLFLSAFFCLGRAIFGRFSYVIWPFVFFISLIVYATVYLNITLDHANLMQVFVTSWTDAQAYFTWSTILCAVVAVMISVVAWNRVYVILKNSSKLTLIFNGLLYFLLFLLSLQPLRNHMQVQRSFVWPLGLAETLSFDCARAVMTINRINKMLENLPQSMEVDAQLDTIKPDDGVVVILHIGESVNASHMQFNGYSRMTTPWLSAQSSMINFKDCVASASSTDRAVLTMVTNGRRSLVDNNDPKYLPTSPGIMDFFAATQFTCGSFWQKEYTDADNSHSFFGRQVEYMNRAAHRVYGYEGDVMNQLLQIDEFLNANKKKNLFLMINNAGSHAFFESYDRENPPFAVKTPPLPTFTPHNNAEHAEIYMNAYDSTIHYTDRYIQQLAEKLKGRPFVYIYMSDHGEYLGDHGYWTRGNAPHSVFYSSGACQVPFFIFASPEFESMNPHFKEALNQLRANQRKSVAHEHLFHTVLGLIGIKTEYYKPELDLTTPVVEEYSGPHPTRGGGNQ